MHHIYANKTKDINTLRPFALTPVLGSGYGLREGRAFQKQFDFMNEKEPV